MCTRVTCEVCGKPGWVGCGRHVEQVLGDVPPAKRCKCREQARAAQHAGERKSLWQRLLGK